MYGLEGKTLSLQLLWEKLFLQGIRRHPFLSSIVGVASLGLIRGVRNYITTLDYEQQLVKTHGDSAYIKSHICFIDVPPSRLRIFYAPHSLVTVLPKPMPLIVFIHGLGGQINMFEPLLKYFGQVADVLAIDLPGCGGSPMIPPDWDQYTSDALATLIKRVLDERCTNRKLILIGHSLGTILVGRIAMLYADKCLATVLLSPKAEISEKEAKGILFITSLPQFVFNFFRRQDRTGGINSKSVTRAVGPNASEDVRIQQLVWNIQSRTPTTLRFLRGARPLTREEWGQVVAPTLIIVGEEDKLCPPTSGEMIRSWLTNPNTPDLYIVPYAGHAILLEAGEIVCDVINEFLVKLEPYLSHAWQLSYTAGENWSLKNEQKWLSIKSVSELVGTSPLRAMKTLRQTDAAHSPYHLIRQYPNVRHVVDISHGVDAAYDPTSFLDTPIAYHKFPTAAKIPPTEEDVAGFITLVNGCLQASHQAGIEDVEISVHCHYGFNRTGFMICCWLIEVEGYSVNEALEAFKNARPNGIRHLHFIATLHRRYPGS